MHLDCCLHFFDVDFLKKYIDVMAFHKVNRFHWHLTEDQGWRLEIKKYPLLTEKGQWRKETVIGSLSSGVYDGTPYGGYYTQEQVRELVQYAAERYVTIIPEIELPGHALAAISCYPELSCGLEDHYETATKWGIFKQVYCPKEETFAFLEDVFDEVIDLFPSELIHIGGDECPKVRWRNCPKCQAKARELGLQNDGKHSVENQLQTYINREVEKFLNERGRDIIGWDETLEGGLTEGAIVMSWRGTDGGIEAARQHHRVIMSPNKFCYIDYYQLKDQWRQPISIGGYLPASKVYSFEPLIPETLTEEEQSYILGPQVNLWTEYIAYPEHLFYMLLPRLDAISEVQWMLSEQKDFDDFKARLPRMLRLYDLMGLTYCRQIE
jgi:hexosaminidase